MPLACRPLDTAAEPAWDAFVAAHPDATFFHRAGWRRVIEQAFGHRTHYLMTERDGVITGVLPLAHVRSLLFGSTLISVPFCVYGGPLAADRESFTLLIAEAGAPRGAGVRPHAVRLAAEVADFIGAAPELAARVGWCDNGVDLDYFAPATFARPFDIEGPNIVFTGTMDYWRLCCSLSEGAIGV